MNSQTYLALLEQLLEDIDEFGDEPAQGSDAIVSAPQVGETDLVALNLR
jgi:hypothetical protein